MNSVKATLFILIASLFLTGCSNKIPMTKKIRDQYDLTTEELQRLQYYISDEVTFKREQDLKKPHYIEDGVLVTRKEKIVDEIVIEKKTPGVAVNVSPKKNTLSVSFEQGFDFPFKISGSGGKYVLRRTDEQHHRQKFYFNNIKYIAYPTALHPHLLIEKEALDDLIEARRVLEGRKLD